MGERPDLDAIGKNMDTPLFYGSPSAMLALQKLYHYCRELEAENKRLNDQITVHLERERDAERRHTKWLAAAGDCGP